MYADEKHVQARVPLRVSIDEKVNGRTMEEWSVLDKVVLMIVVITSLIIALVWTTMISARSLDTTGFGVSFLVSFALLFVTLLWRGSDGPAGYDRAY